MELYYFFKLRLIWISYFSVLTKTIKKDRTFSNLCYEMVEEFNEFIACLKGLRIVSVDYGAYKHASELGKKYLLLPSCRFPLKIDPFFPPILTHLLCSFSSI